MRSAVLLIGTFAGLVYLYSLRATHFDYVYEAFTRTSIEKPSDVATHLEICCVFFAYGGESRYEKEVVSSMKRFKVSSDSLAFVR